MTAPERLRRAAKGRAGLALVAGALLLACRSPREVPEHAKTTAEARAEVLRLARFDRPALGVLVTLVLRRPILDAGAVPDEVVAERCFAELDRIEGLVNLWSEASVLARWNADERERRRVPDELAPLVTRAFEFARESGGAFDPTVGVPLRELGLYGGAAVRVAGPESARAWREHCGFGLVELEASSDGLYVAGPHVELDLSALAKGFAAERVLALCEEAGVEHAFVTLGSSSIAARGDGPDGRGWPVELPSGDGAIAWRLVDEALSVSGQSSTLIEATAKRYSHMFDPRTCAPVDHRTERVVVRGSSAGDCDMASTALLVMGVDEARTWIAAHPEWAARNGAVFWSAPADDDLTREPHPEIVFAGTLPD